ncbi:MAG: hypothetical protein GC146_00355 [Limimaricola sp.]|uniref:hypothetical protein n=1 Tax=Limimaricola sp. TaxID=2211665 RepID=UPI001D3A7B37|nr:hypothetical protein [Limimaricola sp.]MBI1415653.1 hypothetical protein [Limimaricola sp.]
MKNLAVAAVISASGVITIPTLAWADYDTGAINAIIASAYAQCGIEPTGCAAQIQAALNTYLAANPQADPAGVNYMVGQLANVAIRVAAAHPDVRDLLAREVSSLATASTDPMQKQALQSTSTLISSGSMQQLATVAAAIRVASPSG